MKTFKDIAAQGDMLIRRITELPKSNHIYEAKIEKGNYVLAHSETGHNHVVKAAKDVKFYANDNDPFIAYLVVDNTADAVHMRGFDTHESIRFDKGVYEIRRQREYTAEGFRRAID